MSRKNKIAAFIMLLLGVGIFAWELRNTNIRHLVHQFNQINWWWILVGMLMMFGSWLVETVIVQVFLKQEHEQLLFREAVRVPLVEQLFNAITPFSTGGQPAQLFALMQSGIEGGRASSVLLMKFVVYQFMVLVNFILTIAVGFHYIADQLGPLKWFIIFGMVIHVTVIAGLLLVMYRYGFTKRLVAIAMVPVGWILGQKRRHEIGARAEEKIDTFYQESLHLKREKKKVIRASILTLVQLLMYYSVPYFVLLALHVQHVDFLRVLVMHVMIVMIVSLFPIPGGSGGAEYSFSQIFSTFMPHPAQLVLAMLLWRLLTYYLGMICGVVAVGFQPHHGKQLKDKKQIS
ncbi:lysylphosphatidylglycerol synthase transmembrane domain-containing protein [Lacticaseibacillus sharpeae]|uniref:Phosphatidylglycerol lysyltransferase n=1 Tax=Lacticaseibacillus sharpeae JCM 1186 = DSM 20505 TaxID=1291052 RepID=A0A0R1ZJS1_9LACO|nr:lysylphosphatidylglycerol synthase transmembrane domain-containing protein [Lacticaseibacillus sharpeae]KRM55198.1 membrane protein [Lacticaseibacillus sharpeae JCM 1186 = DSM 20505]